MLCQHEDLLRGPYQSRASTSSCLPDAPVRPAARFSSEARRGLEGRGEDVSRRFIRVVERGKARAGFGNGISGPGLVALRCNRSR